MAVVERIGQLIDVGGRLLVIQFAHRLEQMVELTFGRILQYHVDARVIIKIAVEPEYVRMPQMRLYFDFAPELMLTTGLLHLMFENDFQGHYVFASLLPGQIDVAKFAFAKRFAYFEIVQTPLFSFLV